MNATARTQRLRPGFTLVELLVVITIIGVIAGFAIPAVMGALRTARVSGMQTELESFNQAIEAYKNKYGDYPPDFSSWSVVQRHYNKIFTDIDQTELTLLYRLCDLSPDGAANQSDGTAHAFPGSVMDRGEALVWALGGFSSDPQRPFTGTGGPLVLLPGPAAQAANPSTPAPDFADPANYQYNPVRDNRFVEFDAARLSVVPFDPAVSPLATFANRTRSGDEPPAGFNLVNATTGALFLPDLFPTYILYSDSSPVVYFDARTYGFVDTSSNPASTAFNGFARFVDNATDVDGVRPVYSNTANATLVPSDSDGSYLNLAESVRAWNFMNPQTFQLLGPGLDRRFGAITDVDGGALPANAAPVYFQYPTGALIRADDTAMGPKDLVIGVKRYDLSAPPSPYGALQQRENHFLDNMSNFAGKTFGDELP